MILFIYFYFSASASLVAITRSQAATLSACLHWTHRRLAVYRISPPHTLQRLPLYWFGLISISLITPFNASNRAPVALCGVFSVNPSGSGSHPRKRLKNVSIKSLMFATSDNSRHNQKENDPRVKNNAAHRLPRSLSQCSSIRPIR